MTWKRTLLLVTVALGLSLYGQESVRTLQPVIEDGEMGLTWVADAAYVVSSGYASAPVMSRPAALRFVAAMNGGEFENFGFTDWRLPTERELQRVFEMEAAGKLGAPVANISFARSWVDQRGDWVSRDARRSPSEPGVFTWPVRGAEVEPGFADVVAFATNSIDINNGAVIHSGDLVVNDASPGPTLNANVELSIGKVAVSSALKPTGYNLVTLATAQLKADSVKIHTQAVVNGDVSYNELQNNGTINGMLITPLPLPVFNLLPPFTTGVPGATPVTVAAGGSMTLPPGDYAAVVVGDNATLTFTGGVYNVSSIMTGTGASLAFEDASEVRVANRFSSLQNSSIGSAPGAGVLAREVIFFVAGINGATGSLGDEPRAVDIGRNNTVQVNFYAPNGTIRMRRDTAATGAFMARDVLVENSCQLTLDNYFTNNPPEAVDDEATVMEGHSVLIDVLANDSDPDAGDILTATPTVFNGPSNGTAVLDTPPGTFLYTHDGSETTSDSFDYEVCDDGTPIRCDSATVFITVTPVNDPPTAVDDSFAVLEGSSTPSNFSLLDNDSDPENAVLTVSSTGLIRTLAGDIFINADGTFLYNHNGDEIFSDSVVYEVCDEITEVPAKCATATLFISITPVNDPPVANPGSVQLPGQAGDDGSAGPNNAVDIVLTGSDAEGSTLLFSIFSGPSNGTLSAITPIDATSAMVTYTSNDPFLADSFVFEVDDQQGGTDTATIQIAASPSAPLGTVAANDRTAEVPQNTPTLIQIVGNAPDGVALSFSVVSGPTQGMVSALTPGTEVPQRSASLTYTPANDYTGPDSFTFEACGEINSTIVCDQATVSITVIGRIAAPQQIRTFNDFPMTIDLSGQPIPADDGEGGSSPPPDPRVPNQRRPDPSTGGLRAATILVPAVVAGAVSDSNGDGIGDEANVIPGPVPVLASAAVDSSGGVGVNGVVRFHMEFALADVPSLGIGDRAFVNISTNKGTTDVLDTFFYAAGVNADGELTALDFNSGLFQLPGVVLEVPPDPVGTNGTFLIDVTDLVKQLQSDGLFTHLVVQGRVDESLAGGGSMRGLQMRTSADNNVTAGLQPQLQIQQPVYRITVAPVNGVLRDVSGQLLPLNQPLADRRVVYTPNSGFLGLDSFSFSATLNQIVETAIIDLEVVVGTCQDNVFFCNDGRSGN